MSTEMKRFMISLPEDLAEQVEAVKKEEFYNKSYSEMYRHLIALAFESLDDKAQQSKEPKIG